MSDEVTVEMVFSAARKRWESAVMMRLTTGDWLWDAEHCRTPRATAGITLDAWHETDESPSSIQAPSLGLLYEIISKQFPSLYAKVREE